MSTVATAFGIEDALIKLGIKELNPGTSTGNVWYSGEDTISSF